MKKRGLDMSKLFAVMALLRMGKPLPAANREHLLRGEYFGQMECHIEPDWLLVYLRDDDIGEIYFTDTGTHADLFQ